jgi:hypothetical protein
VFPEYQEGIVWPFVLVVVSAQRRCGTPSRPDDVRPALFGELPQGLVKVRSLGGQDGDDLFSVAVGGRPRHTGPGRERGPVFALA